MLLLLGIVADVPWSVYVGHLSGSYKMAEPFKMLFGLWSLMTWVGPRNHELDGGLEPPTFAFGEHHWACPGLHAVDIINILKIIDKEHAFSALTLVVSHQEKHPACKI